MSTADEPTSPEAYLRQPVSRAAIFGSTLSLEGPREVFMVLRAFGDDEWKKIDVKPPFMALPSHIPDVKHSKKGKSGNEAQAATEVHFALFPTGQDASKIRDYIKDLTPDDPAARKFDQAMSKFKPEILYSPSPVATRFLLLLQCLLQSRKAHPCAVKLDQLAIAKTNAREVWDTELIRAALSTKDVIPALRNAKALLRARIATLQAAHADHRRFTPDAALLHHRIQKIDEQVGRVLESKNMGQAISTLTGMKEEAGSLSEGLVLWSEGKPIV